MPINYSIPIALTKRRIRAHIIADLSANYVEKIAIKKGYAVQSVQKDYGYDLNIYTFNRRGEAEPGTIIVQLKATDRLQLLRYSKNISFVADKRDLQLWSREVLPVLLILYDAKRGVGYWLHVQIYLRNIPGFDINKVRKKYTLRIPRKNIINRNALGKIRTYKNWIVNKMQHAIRF